MANYEAAASATAWRSVCLCSLPSTHPAAGNIVLLKTRILQLSIDPPWATPPSSVRTPWDLLVSSLSPPFSPPCQAQQAEQMLVSTVPLPRVCTGRTPQWGATANPISKLNQNSSLCRSCPAILELAEWKKRKKSLLDASSSPGLLLLPAGERSSSSASALAIKTLRMLPVMLSLPVAQTICRVVFLGMFRLKTTRFLSLGRCLLAKTEI